MTAQCLGGEETVLVGTVVTDKHRPAPLERRMHGERVERRTLVGSPWARFRHGMAEQDLKDVVAYLRSVPPIKNRVPEAQPAPPPA